MSWTIASRTGWRYLAGPKKKKKKKKKARLLAQATTKNKKQKSKIWARIHDIQNKIHELEVLTFKEAHQWWWDKLSKINCKDNAREFWKTIKLVRKPNSHEPFPTVMEHEGKFVKTKQEIKIAITDYYENVDNNKDKEALNFIEMFPLEPDSQPETQVIPDGKLEPLVNLQSVQKAIKKQKTKKQAAQITQRQSASSTCQIT